MEPCPATDQLAEFVEGLSSRDRLLRVEGHLAECESCRLVLGAIAPKHRDGHAIDAWDTVATSLADERDGSGHPSKDASSVAQASVTALRTVRDETRIALCGDRETAKAAHLRRGDSLGRYRIEGVLGAGGMGVVYAAYDPVIDRRVALKVIRFDAHDPNRRARVFREAQAMARVAHPDVITVHDVGEFETELFIAMELVEGGTLRQWVAKRPRTTGEILDVFVRAGKALAKAHAVGVVHRDFKPDNVLVAEDGRVRVTDFGLACNVHDEKRTPSAASSRSDAVAHGGPTAIELTHSSGFLGTPAYMSPEQLRGDRATIRSDVFSFSVALWEALYKQRPYLAETVGALERRIDAGDISPPAGSYGADAALRRALLGGLAAEPAKRYASMDEFVAAIERSRRAPPKLRRTRMLLAAAGLAVVVVSPVGWIQLQRAARLSLSSEAAQPTPVRASVTAPLSPLAIALPLASAVAPADPPAVALSKIADRSESIGRSSAPAPPPAAKIASPAVSSDPFGASRE